MIQVFDNWCNPVVQNIFNSTLTGSHIEWKQPYSKGSTVSYNLAEKMVREDKNVVDPWQVVHSVVIDGKIYSSLYHLSAYILQSFFEIVYPDKQIENLMIERIKFNYQGQQLVPNKKLFYSPPHTDPIALKTPPEGFYPFVAIYYAEDSDGDTFFFDGYTPKKKIIKRVSPKAGRMVVFNGDLAHCGSPPQQHSSRIVANYNFYLPVNLGL